MICSLGEKNLLQSISGGWIGGKVFQCLRGSVTSSGCFSRGFKLGNFYSYYFFRGCSTKKRKKRNWALGRRATQEAEGVQNHRRKLLINKQTNQKKRQPTRSLRRYEQRGQKQVIRAAVKPRTGRRRLFREQHSQQHFRTGWSVTVIELRARGAAVRLHGEQYQTHLRAPVTEQCRFTKRKPSN